MDSGDFSKHSSTDTTYKELKHPLNTCPMPKINSTDTTYKELKLPLALDEAMDWARTDTTYKELKPGKITVKKYDSYTRTDTTYKELKRLSYSVLDALYSVLILPIRN